MTISGTAETNSRVEVFQDGISVGVTTADGTGAWSLADPNTLSIDTTYQFTVTAMDAAGYRSALSASYAVTIDTAAPAGIAGEPINLGLTMPSTAAISGNDYLTGSSSQDLFVFAQPIGHDIIYSFDANQDQIDLIGYAGFASFNDVAGHLSTDANGNAVIALADGQSITLDGVAAASLTVSNFVFDETPVTNNAGTMTIGDGALLPLSGIVNNTGTIALEAGTARIESSAIGPAADWGPKGLADWGAPGASNVAWSHDGQTEGFDVHPGSTQIAAAGEALSSALNGKAGDIASFTLDFASDHFDFRHVDTNKDVADSQAFQWPTQTVLHAPSDVPLATLGSSI